jgi:hypothetical protein
LTWFVHFSFLPRLRHTKAGDAPGSFLGLYCTLLWEKSKEENGKRHGGDDARAELNLLEVPPWPNGTVLK